MPKNTKIARAQDTADTKLYARAYAGRLAKEVGLKPRQATKALKKRTSSGRK